MPLPTQSDAIVHESTQVGRAWSAAPVQLAAGLRAAVWDRDDLVGARRVVFDHDKRAALVALARRHHLGALAFPGRVADGGLQPRQS